MQSVVRNLSLLLWFGGGVLVPQPEAKECVYAGVNLASSEMEAERIEESTLCDMSAETTMQTLWAKRWDVNARCDWQLGNPVVVVGIHMTPHQ